MFVPGSLVTGRLWQTTQPMSGHIDRAQMRAWMNKDEDMATVECQRLMILLREFEADGAVADHIVPVL
jgi:hypothetical protein